MTINKIIAVEGLDKTGKSTFCNAFEGVYTTLSGLSEDVLNKTSFPNINSPIGAMIRTELNSAVPNTDIINSANFLAEMAHYWMGELYNNAMASNPAAQNNNIVPVDPNGQMNYLFDRYFISTLAYQAFYNNNRADLDFIKTALRVDGFLKLPTDIVFLDLPNDEIIRRTLEDQEEGINDANDTLDITIIDKRRKAFQDALKFLKNTGVNIHYITDAGELSPEDLSKMLIGKIF